MEFSLKTILESVLIGIISTLLAMVLFFIPVLNIAVLLFPVPPIIVSVRRGVWAGIGSLAVSSILLGLLTHPFLGIIVFLLNLFIVVGLSIAFKKSLEMNECVILGSTGVLLSLLSSLQVFAWMVGESFFDFLWNNLKNFFISNSANINKLVEVYETWGIIDKAYSAERLAEVLVGQMKDLMPMFPSMLLVTSLICGGLNFLVARMVLKRLRCDVPNVPEFWQWTLPRGTGRGFMAIILVAFIGARAGIPNFDIVLYTISSVFSFVFSIQGLAVVNSFLQQRNIPNIVQWLILIILFVFLSSTLTFLGIFEQIFGMRRASPDRRRS